MTNETLESLLERVTERRRELLTSVVDRRTRHFCMVLEDLFDPHNISAVIRTAEVFGLQDVHIISEGQLQVDELVPIQETHALHGKTPCEGLQDCGG